MANYSLRAIHPLMSRSFSLRVPRYRQRKSYRVTRSRNKDYICRINMLFETICHDNMSLPHLNANIATKRLNDMPFNAGHVLDCTPKESMLHIHTRTHTHSIRNFLSRISRQQRIIIESRRCPSHESLLIICLQRKRFDGIAAIITLDS